MKLPNDFISEIEGYNAPIFSGLFESLSNTLPSVSVRFNRHKNGELNIDSPIKWCEYGKYLNERVPFTFDPAMHQGLYYVQDASSMFISHIIMQLTKEEPIRYLDACAAPGGKTTAAIDALPPGSLVVANEYVPNRAMVLSENLTKWGYSSVVVSKGDTAKYKKLKNFFDIVAADVPCSGEGMFRKDEEAVAQWSLSLVNECVSRQKEILDNLWQSLKPGGFLIYSTCTFNRHENESMIDYLVEEYDALPVKIDLPEESGIAKGINAQEYCYRFLPHLVKGEGLFISVVQKKGGEYADVKPVKNKRKSQEKPSSIKSEIKEWIIGEDFDFSVDKEQVVAIPQMWKAEMLQLKSALDVIHMGLSIATIKGKDYIPSHALAMSTEINRAAFNICEVDYKTAISYLRREAIVLNEAPRGYVLLTYNNNALGFVKNLGNRANNLYPQEWRILSSHVPDVAPNVIEN